MAVNCRILFSIDRIYIRYRGRRLSDFLFHFTRRVSSTHQLLLCTPSGHFFPTVTMFAIQPSHKPSSASENEPSTKRCTPNILPCRIHHDGPIQLSDRYWAPSSDEQRTTQNKPYIFTRNLMISETSHTAHFRGRKLRGRRVAIPEGYQGQFAITWIIRLN